MPHLHPLSTERVFLPSSLPSPFFLQSMVAIIAIFRQKAAFWPIAKPATGEESALGEIKKPFGSREIMYK